MKDEGASAPSRTQTDAAAVSAPPAASTRWGVVSRPACGGPRGRARMLEDCPQATVLPPQFRPRGGARSLALGVAGESGMMVSDDPGAAPTSRGGARAGDRHRGGSRRVRRRHRQDLVVYFRDPARNLVQVSHPFEPVLGRRRITSTSTATVRGAPRKDGPPGLRGQA